MHLQGDIKGLSNVELDSSSPRQIRHVDGVFGLFASNFLFIWTLSPSLL
jgi:hypothetical protein